MQTVLSFFPFGCPVQKQMIQREETTRTVRLSADRCTFTFERLDPGVLLVTISGYDRGGFGTAVLDEFAGEMRRFAALEIFIDASEAQGATWEVSQQWTSWFRAHRDHLARVSILVRSKFLRQTIAVAKELSRTGDLIAIYSDPDRFAEALRERVPDWGGPNRPADD